MQASSFDMLRHLAGLAPAPVDSGARPRDPVSSASFGDLLKRAEAGTLSSQRPMSVDKNAGVTLTDEQMTRVGAAADRAEAAGAGTATVLIDGMAIRVDVLGRRILGKVQPDSVSSDTDAVVAAAEAGSTAQAIILGPPGSGGLNASLLKALADREGESAAA
jgi:hypothetical protein